MHINPKQYEIDGLKIDWGKTFSEVSTSLDRFEKIKSYEGWPNIRCKCKSIYGLAATEMEIRAPFVDRPVLQVQYELSPIEPTFFQKLHSPFVKQLEKVLGRPVKKENIDHHPGLKKEYISSAVVYSAKWLFDDIRISLSIFGGTRNNDSGPAAAGIFIDWIDEKKAAEPFRLKNKILEQELLGYLTDTTDIEKYVLSYKQRKFFLTHIDIGDPDVTKDDDLRVAQMALYRNEFLPTPNILQNKLKDNEIAVKFIDDAGRLVIANRWDATILNYRQEQKISFSNVLPGRGSGEYILQVKDLSINDSRKSDVLIRLTSYIENKTGIKVKRSEYLGD